MGEQISWSVNVQIAGGPKVSLSQSLNVQAYDKVSVEVPGGEVATPGTATVEVQPADAAGRVQFILIRSDRYGEALTYTVEGAGGASAVALDAPQLLVGKGAVGLLGTAPQNVTFENGLGDGNAANVAVLVGRQAS